MAEPAKKRRKKKKLSPSDVRRNERRRQEFLKRKSKGAKCEGSVLQTPEKERAPHQVADLQLTPVHQQRDEEDEMPSSLQSPPPTLPLVCDLPHWNTGRHCGKTFSSEDYLKIHVHSSGLH